MMFLKSEVSHGELKHFNEAAGADGRCFHKTVPSGGGGRGRITMQPATSAKY
jgi:hypothetical protein